MTWYLWPFAIVYAVLRKLKNIGYDLGLRRTYSVGVPVVSVGNIIEGGTGKTPVIEHIVHWAQTENLKVGIVARGYRGRFHEGVSVDRDIKDQGADHYGAVAYMLASRYPNVPVYVGADRVATAKKLVDQHSVDFLIVDDAYQQRRLVRHYDILVLDVMEPLKNYRPRPIGMGREGLDSALRADMILLNKVNLAPLEHAVKLAKILSGLWTNKKVKRPDVAQGVYNLKRVYKYDDPSREWDKMRLSGILVSAIGRPSSFERLLNLDNIKFKKHVIFQDHHDYSLPDISEIIYEMNCQGVDSIITTEKDAVKLVEYPVIREYLWIADLELKFTEQIEQMYKVLRKKIKKED